MKKHFKLAALLLALLLAASTAFASETPITIGSDAYKAATTAVEEDSSASTSFLGELLVGILQNMSVEERYQAMQNWDHAFGSLGHMTVGVFQRYYAAKYPEGDLICTCAALLPYHADGHAANCPWAPVENEIVEDGVTVSGNIPADVELTVEKDVPAEELLPYMPELGVMDNDYRIFDLSLLKADNTEWQPTDGDALDVTLDVSDMMETDGDVLLYHVHVNEDGTETQERLGVYSTQNGKVQFRTPNFSYFIVVNGSLVSRTINDVLSFYTVAGTATNKHIIASAVYFTNDGHAHLLLSADQQNKAESVKATKVTIEGNEVTSLGETTNFGKVNSEDKFYVENNDLSTDVTSFYNPSFQYIIGIDLGPLELTDSFHVDVTWNDGSSGGFAIEGMETNVVFNDGVQKRVYNINGTATEALSPEVNAGNVIIYAVEVKNEDDSTQAVEGKVTDKLPSGIFDRSKVVYSLDPDLAPEQWTTVTYVSNDPISEDYWTFTLADNLVLETGKSVTYYIRAIVDSNTEARSYTNTAYFRGKSSSAMVRVSEEVEIKATKVWDDNNNIAGLRPIDITVELQRSTNNGAWVTYDTQKLSDENQWTYSWTEKSKVVNETTEEVTQYTYRVIEIPSIDSYKTSYTNEGYNYTITNTLDVSSLTIDKTVIKEDSTNTADLPDDTFDFTVKLDIDGDYAFSKTKSDQTTEAGTLTIENGTGTVSLKNGESVKIDGITINSDYVVTEGEKEYYTSSSTNATGKIAATGSTASFVNTYTKLKTNSLIISKTVETIGGMADTNNPSFDFEVELKDAAGTALTGTYKYTIGAVEKEITLNAGKATIQLKAGESAVFEAIPVTTQYSVKEDTSELPTGYALKTGVSQTQSGAINVTAQSTASFTNTYTTTSVEVSKTVVGKDAPKTTDEFDFTLTLTESNLTSVIYTKGADTETKYTLSLTNGVGTFKLKDGESVTFIGIPVGAGYKVEEASKTNYVTTIDEEEVSFAEGTLTAEKVTVDFTNTYQLASLTITKEGLNAFIYPEGDHESAIFTVKAAEGYEDMDSREWTVAINGDGSVTIKGVKVGVAYTVTEANDWTWRYNEAASQDSEVITVDGDTVEFKNSLAPNGKQWLGGDNYKVNIFGKPAAPNN